MLAYPTEQDKAKYIAIFWAIFNLGGVVGSAVAFGQNFHTTVFFFHLSKLMILIMISHRPDLVWFLVFKNMNST
jgi:hypothetical protein